MGGGRGEGEGRLKGDTVPLSDWEGLTGIIHYVSDVGLTGASV